MRSVDAPGEDEIGIANFDHKWWRLYERGW
jgi:hypothetical protein